MGADRSNVLLGVVPNCFLTDDVASYLWEERSVFHFYFFYEWWNVALKTHFGVVFHQDALLDL